MSQGGGVVNARRAGWVCFAFLKFAFFADFNGDFVLTFTKNPASQFFILTSTNLSLPATGWRMTGTVTNIAVRLFQYARAG